MPTPYTGIVGNRSAQEDQFLEGAPSIWIQERVTGVNLLNNPDSDGYYWGLSGTSSYPAYEIGCYEGVSLGESIDINTIRCDKEGDQAGISKRNYVEVSFTLKSLLPFAVVAKLLNWSSVLTSSDYEKTGIGVIDNNKFYRMTLVKVYDDASGDYVLFQGHRVQFVQNSQVQMTYGQPWSVEVTARAYADPNMPDAQKFMTVIRHDAAAL